MDVESINNNIISTFDENKNSHAFLMSTNNIDKCLKDIIKIIKYVNCVGTKKSDCTCNICNTISTETNPDLIIVRPDGKEIKKDSILELVSRFSTNPTINKYSMYIIVNAERLNISSSNKILKFLEEPESKIVGFFLTENLQSIIPTIKSRCEIFKYNYEVAGLLDFLEINEEDYQKYSPLAMELLDVLNSKNKFEMMNNVKKIAKLERNEIDIILKLVKKFYELKYDNIKKSKEIDDPEVLKIVQSIVSNDLISIVKRLNLLDNIINDFKLNVNKELFLNKLCLEWE